MCILSSITYQITCVLKQKNLFSINNLIQTKFHKINSPRMCININKIKVLKYKWVLTCIVNNNCLPFFGYSTYERNKYCIYTVYCYFQQQWTTARWVVLVSTFYLLSFGVAKFRTKISPFSKAYSRNLWKWLQMENKRALFFEKKAHKILILYCAYFDIKLLGLSPIYPNVTLRS